MSDPYSLNRFVEAQQPVYARVFQELQAGHKRSHWMWFVFPQLQGLGRSEMAARYAISGLEEARAYLAHEVLGHRLKRCVTTLLQHTDKSARQILGTPDDLKLRSCLTLFDSADPDEPLWQLALMQFFDGTPDAATLGRLGR
ncbi:MAG: hypothetical protein K0S77_800 [Pseudomonas sp.]|jgi:uncharacterized protein (DUF1810 family)|uniref:DUF1810 domain-containing protein n=1 Tax=Pseudomonas entomophila TaxID=312306 RepID=UPI0015E2B293|nr:DUF1810 domain-containing protein [Pseudomonas entomophila]MBA1193313.1 DUF1810 domain-containing protein [Pseudomonas entomophila]MDF2488178.1 hypothetical protein [Pseudomonas sp.]